MNEPETTNEVEIESEELTEELSDEALDRDATEAHICYCSNACRRLERLP